MALALVVKLLGVSPSGPRDLGAQSVRPLRHLRQSRINVPQNRGAPIWEPKAPRLMVQSLCSIVRWVCLA
eukprot:12242024-Heterocapsa_arctica.AAC.2